jgi:peroxin-5
VQVALGVLFNASEDYDKAVDCFTAALSVRPDDWLLYNRLGATLSNSGRSEEALRYYHQALDLRPGFVRCHFNLSISCLNLKLYQDAASHIYTALMLQSESAMGEGGDGMMQQDQQEFDNNGGGVASGSLWETLRVSCELMNRSDLADLTKDRDLNKFDPSDFWAGGSIEQI